MEATTQKKRKERLDPRQLTFVEQYALTGNAYQSAITAGYSENFAKQMTVRMTEKVRSAVEDQREEYGLTEELIKNSLVEDIKSKPGNRKPELELGARILNLVRETPGNTSVQFNQIVLKVNQVLDDTPREG